MQRKEGGVSNVSLNEPEEILGSEFRDFINGRIDREEYNKTVKTIVEHYVGGGDVQELNAEKKNEILNAIEFGEASGELGQMDKEALEAVKFNLNIPYGSERTSTIGGNTNVLGAQSTDKETRDTSIYVGGDWDVTTLLHEGNHANLNSQEEEKLVRALDLVRANIQGDSKEATTAKEFIADSRGFLGDADDVTVGYAKEIIFKDLASQHGAPVHKVSGADDGESIAKNRKKIAELLGIPVNDSGFWSEDFAQALEPYPRVREIVGKLLLGEQVYLNRNEVGEMPDDEFAFFVNLIPLVNRSRY